MNHKVLLADDSLTIQKVIKITLANQPYDITEASSEEELFQRLPELKPKLVFLDFNLSEKYSGYELSSKIKAILPSAKVLLLLGTFDSVDESSMEKCGASDKIVKPFDSNKFIAICRQLVDSFDEHEDLAYPEIKSETENKNVAPSEEEQWTVTHTTEQSHIELSHIELSPKVEATAPFLENPLLKEVSDWGMTVPGVINHPKSADNQTELPPVIVDKDLGPLPASKVPASVSPVSSNQDEAKYPKNEDLDYPTIEELSANSHELSGVAEPPKTSSKLISIDQFKDPPLEIERDFYDVSSNDEENTADIQSLQDQIREELAEDLWQVDEFEELKKEVSTKIEEVKSNFQPTINDFDESLFRPLDDSQSLTWNDASELSAKTESKQQPAHDVSSTMNIDQFKVEMEEMVKKYVKEYMDQIFQKNVEKIAWEVIPDLAENLIRQELSKITSKILNE
jgi:DNA-binding response OmpR family regulator